MPTCPDCHDDEGRPREVPISMTRRTATGTETTLRCPLCGWQDTQPDGLASPDGTAGAARSEPPSEGSGDDDRSRAA